MPRRYGGQASPQSTSSLSCEGMEGPSGEKPIQPAEGKEPGAHSGKLPTNSDTRETYRHM